MAIVFGLQPDITVVAQAGSLAEARGVLADVDVAVVDLGLPDGSGLDLIGELRAVNPESAVLVLTASSDRAQFARAVEAGAAGVLHKSTPLHELVGAVRRLIAGEQLLTVSSRSTEPAARWPRGTIGGQGFSADPLRRASRRPRSPVAPPPPGRGTL